MRTLHHDLKHLNKDVKIIHDRLEHLSSHSKVCNELVRESNYREANELFSHLEEIDKLIHGVQQHIVHLEKHVEQYKPEFFKNEPLDIDDLKDDVKHTSYDLKDIHLHIEHLISHTEMCRDIMSPTAEEELYEIKGHLKDIDDTAHEILEHINEIRGRISSKFSEFIWEIPSGYDEYLLPTRLIDSNNSNIEDIALKLVDGVESIEKALINLMCFVRDFIRPTPVDEHIEANAATILMNYSGSGIGKSILVCALSRAVSIPSQIHFAKVDIELWSSLSGFQHLELPAPNKPFTISWPEFFINNKWEAGFNIVQCESNISYLYERFIDLGIKSFGQELNINSWQRLPIDDFEDNGAYNKPYEYLSSPTFSPPPCEIERRLFAGSFYTGKL
jgi:hypothetical protein